MAELDLARVGKDYVGPITHRTSADQSGGVLFRTIFAGIRLQAQITFPELVNLPVAVNRSCRQESAPTQGAPLALKALRATLPHFAFPEKGGTAFSSAVKFLMKNSMYLFRLSTVASRSYAIVYPRTFLIGRG